MSMKNSNDTIGNRTRDLPTCSAVSQPTAPPRAPGLKNVKPYKACWIEKRRSQWPRGLSRASAAARFLGLRIRISPGARLSVSCECCVLSVRGLCVWLITRPEESYRLWCVVVCDLKNSMSKPRFVLGRSATGRKIHVTALNSFQRVYIAAAHRCSMLTHWGRGHLNCLNARSRGF